MAAAEVEEVITREAIEDLIYCGFKNSYLVSTKEPKSAQIMETCLRLFSKDYKYSVNMISFRLINNTDGNLCDHYPEKIAILEQLNTETNTNEKFRSSYNGVELHNLIYDAKIGRCRERFVVPVILFEGKHICRSSTLAVAKEMMLRSCMNAVYSITTPRNLPFDSDQSQESVIKCSLEDLTDEEILSPYDVASLLGARSSDIKLLKMFKVSYIFDLMVEDCKVKYYLNFSSSEKVDDEYQKFRLSSLPYPGCEYFKEWKERKYVPETLVFNWKAADITATFKSPENLDPPEGIKWEDYKEWDLMTLTRNYLKLILYYLKFSDRSVLVHCISGWDRTPLFISLLRLTLWADGAIHQSLSVLEMLYLTVAYDWYLFGHCFPVRNKRGEEIFLFCFTFLKEILNDEYNIYEISQNLSSTVPGESVQEQQEKNSDSTPASALSLADQLKNADQSDTTNSSKKGCNNQQQQQQQPTTDDINDPYIINDNDSASLFLTSSDQAADDVNKNDSFNMADTSAENDFENISISEIDEHSTSASTKSTSVPIKVKRQPLQEQQNSQLSNVSPLNTTFSRSPDYEFAPAFCYSTFDHVLHVVWRGDQPQSERREKLMELRTIFHELYKNALNRAQTADSEGLLQTVFSYLSILS
ncbi:hypothetical protein HELRODRAFT_190283 [Helobdella robusta]|uniref:Tyrosine specific protein phosphatases domain-containing protein n=1 Tax=Helobdella robusta TaxID=6412 RepID=T1FRV0_HELRO|nr:hypothetical protein HELRODRAFT_190283 [Helobdella robusta]ESO11037.1 hypothetical protein HELRODRAFT_190283 [Helobdella robusta]